MPLEIDAEAIANYLDTRNDFDLELFAHRELRRRGWPSHHGGTYKDGVTGKYRQYDVRAVKNFAMNTCIAMTVECKSLTSENPLIISRVPRSDYDSYHHVTHCMNDEDVPNTTTFSVEKSGIRLPFYPSGEMVGKATTQLRWDKKGEKFNSADGETYEKWSQALAAAADALTDAPILSGDGIGYTFWMPVLLVSDNTLWVVDYDEEAVRSKPQKEDAVTLFVGRENHLDGGHRVDFTHLHVYTRIGFQTMLGNLSAPRSTMWERMFGFLFRPESRA